MKITLKDGSKKEYAEAKSVIDIAYDISEGLARAACAGEVNGEVVDLRTVLEDDCELNILTARDEKGLAVLRHTASHVMAQAVQNLYPEAKVAIGPSIDTGFYYDFDCPPFSRDDLDAIEKEMKKIIKKGAKIERFTKSREDAIAYFQEKNEPYKVELIEDLPEGSEISFYSQGDWTDLCAGPHLMSVKGVKAFKLLSSSSAYWRGSEKNAMLTRIYGTAYASKDELKEHLEQMEEAKKRDHNKLGREMKIFTTVDVIGQGLPLIMPNGVIMMQELQRWIEDEETKRGYIRTKTPLMAKSDLYKISGHWDHYKDNMYTSMVDDREFAIKPMNCPGALLVYNSTLHSYKDLPLRLGELGQVHRHEASGALNGLFRVRTFTQDDAHLFVTPDQLEEEVKKVLQLVDRIYSVFGLPYEIELSTRPESGYIGSEEIWDASEKALAQACVHAGKEYKVNPGDGAFYGPKLDFMVKDAIGRRWQLGTIQVDYNLPERFQLEYMGSDNQKHRPVMIHRAPFGSMERFVAVLIEHTAGKFPLWLTPDQVAILPISEKFNEYAEKVKAELRKFDVRAIVDDRNEKIGRKIRDNEMKRIPYMLIVGEKEAENGEVAVRKQGEGDKGTMKIEEFGKNLAEEVSNMINKW